MLNEQCQNQRVLVNSTNGGQTRRKSVIFVNTSVRDAI